MAAKTCFKCGEKKDLNLFYKHPQMGDGHLNKCIECAKRDVTENRLKNVDYYREYDRERGGRRTKEDTADYRRRFPKKWKAVQMVAKAIQKKYLTPKTCEVCGSNEVHGHHPDYSKPLDVMWLCAEHHCEWHSKNGEGLNGT